MKDNKKKMKKNKRKMKKDPEIFEIVQTLNADISQLSLATSIDD